MKHLKAIQTIAKIAKILSIIVFVCSIIGACGCAIGLVALGIIGNSDAMDIFYAEMQLNLPTTIFSSISGFVWCISEIIVSYMAMNYFKRELEDGTPFTYGGAQQMLRLGIFGIALPLAASIIDSVVYSIFATINGNALSRVQSATDFDITFGITLIFLSLLCKHGAELAEKVQQSAAETSSETDTQENQEQFEESQE